MFFENNFIYHIYNRSNEKVFYSNENYLFFLKKMNELIKPNCEILCWCLMPNHFHLMIQATEKSAEFIQEKHREQTQILSKNIGTLLSSYTQAINKQVNRRGNLWAHNTEAVPIETLEYATNCLHYIHQNPKEAELVESMELWEYSSYRDFAGLRKGKLANVTLACELLELPPEYFIEQSEKEIDEKIINNFYK